jgi:hypothetical protein
MAGRSSETGPEKRLRGDLPARMPASNPVLRPVERRGCLAHRTRRTHSRARPSPGKPSAERDDGDVLTPARRAPGHTRGIGAAARMRPISRYRSVKVHGAKYTKDETARQAHSRVVSRTLTAMIRILSGNGWSKEKERDHPAPSCDGRLRGGPQPHGPHEGPAWQYGIVPALSPFNAARHRGGRGRTAVAGVSGGGRCQRVLAARVLSLDLPCGHVSGRRFVPPEKTDVDRPRASNRRLAGFHRVGSGSGGVSPLRLARPADSFQRGVRRRTEGLGTWIHRGGGISVCVTPDRTGLVRRLGRWAQCRTFCGCRCVCQGWADAKKETSRSQRPPFLVGPRAGYRIALPRGQNRPAVIAPSRPSARFAAMRPLRSCVRRVAAYRFGAAKAVVADPGAELVSGTRLPLCTPAGGVPTGRSTVYAEQKAHSRWASWRQRNPCLLGEGGVRACGAFVAGRWTRVDPNGDGEPHRRDRGLHGMGYCE